MCQKQVRLFSSAAVARKVREVPVLPRDDYLRSDKIRRPVYMSECRGTPRREYPVNAIDGIRVSATFNPYQTLTKERRFKLDTWKSRDWDSWDPYSCYFGVGGRRYQLPQDLYCKSGDDIDDDINPPIAVVGRHAMADMKKQYIMHGIPWVWDKDFYTAKIHPREREPTLGRKRYIPDHDPEKTREALRNMDEMKLQYFKERREKKRYTWWERVVRSMGGEQALEQYARIQKIPRLL